MELNEQGLYDIYELNHVPFWQTPLFKLLIKVGIAGLSLVLAIAVGYILYKFFKKKKNPWDCALDEINGLTRGYAYASQAKFFYSRLTFILKNYLGERYLIDLKGKTDKEMIAFLKRYPFEQALIDEVEDIFIYGQEIKFSDYRARQQEIERHGHLACMIVKRTIPEPTKNSK